ncbi:Uncharacterized protein FWK35_00035033, partial [Aphis craccivora]
SGAQPSVITVADYLRLRYRKTQKKSHQETPVYRVYPVTCSTIQQKWLTKTSKHQKKPIKRHLSAKSDGQETSKKKPMFVTTNRFALLTTDNQSDPTTSSSQTPFNAANYVDAQSKTNLNYEGAPSRSNLPPPIIVRGVLDFIGFRDELVRLIGSDNFFFKSSTNDLKIQTTTPEYYRKPYRIVIRNLHPSTPTVDIGIAIEGEGYTVRQVSNIIHKTTKVKLPIFFVDLDPAEINKEIFNLISLLHTRVKIEEPHKRKDIVQCLNCQEYGHSRKYCAYPPRCVRCGEHHPSTSCVKTRDTPATCALCKGDHPANSETHFTSNTKFSIPGYTIIPANHPDNTAHAGAAILIRSPIQFTPLPSINEDFLQAAAINIKLNHVPITIVASYCPPRHKITQTQFENFFNDFSQYFIIGGDLNAKHQSWGCHTTNPKGQALLKAVNNKQLSILAPPNPTYWPSSPRKRSDILDIFVTKIPPNLNHLVKNLLDPCSDHSPILLCIDASPQLQPSNPSLINGIMNWEQFRDIINQKLKLNIRLKCPRDIDDAVLNLTQIIQSAAWNSTTQPNKNNNHNHLSILHMSVN